MQSHITFTKDEIRICFYSYAQPQGSVNVNKNKHTWYDKKNYTFRDNLRALFYNYNFDRPFFKRGVPVEMNIYIFRKMLKGWGKTKQEKASKGHIMPVTKPDNSNCRKQIEDALTGIVYWDDAQICDGHDYKRYGYEEKIDIIIKRIDVDE